MGFYDVWPCVLVTTALVFLAGTPLLRSADSPPTLAPVRVQTIDGLRGFLALGVFFHHASIYHQYLLTGDWALPPSRFYANLGQSGVAMFFMITGYLFWTQMLKAMGRPNLLRLFIGRVFRIVPLYLLLACIVLVSVGILTGWHRNEPPRALARDVATWLAGGILTGGDVNGYHPIGISAGVTWSLSYEWIFYASLLVTSLFARHVMTGVLLPVVGLMAAVPMLLRHPQDLDLICTLMFLVGMTAASARHSLVLDPIKTSHPVMSVALVGCLAVVLLAFNGVYRVLPITILGLAFWLIVSGATLFGLLLTQAARRLGDISYGIYLLQGPVLFLAFAWSFVRSLVATSPWVHWAVVTLAAVVLVMLATVTHSLIERPGIEVGRWVSAKLASSRRRHGVRLTC